MSLHKLTETYFRALIDQMFGKDVLDNHSYFLFQTHVPLQFDSLSI